MHTTRSANISQFEGKRVVLTFDDGQTLMLDKSEITPGAEVGDQFSVIIQPTSEAQLSKEDLARTLLNEILKT